VPDKGWVLAGDLHVGDILLTIENTYHAIKGIKYEKLETPIKVYNFEVEDFHTYFVSDLEVLVHNKPAGGRNIEKIGKNKGNAPRSNQAQKNM
jgi:hypothetical protein